MSAFIWQVWPENYGNRERKPTLSLIHVAHVLRAGQCFRISVRINNGLRLADPRIVLLGFSLAFFEASLYIYVIEWTPALQQAAGAANQELLPLGFIFALFMVRCDLFLEITRHSRICLVLPRDGLVRFLFTRQSNSCAILYDVNLPHVRMLSTFRLFQNHLPGGFARIISTDVRPEGQLIPRPSTVHSTRCVLVFGRAHR